MATTITWSIQKESHVDRTEKYINLVLFSVKGEDTVGVGDEAKTYTDTYDGIMKLEKPDTLIDYSTFNKQSTLIEAVKTKLGSSEVTRIENSLKEGVLDHTDPLSTVPPT